MQKLNREDLLDKLMTEMRNNSTKTIMFHQAIATHLGLNPTDHKCLEIIFENHAITPGELAGLLGLTTGAVTGVIDRLENKGFVFRELDSDDRRRIIIKVNQEKSEETILPLFGSFGEQIESVLEKYNNDNLEIILNFFRDINSIVKQEKNKLLNGLDISK